MTKNQKRNWINLIDDAVKRYLVGESFEDATKLYYKILGVADLDFGTMCYIMHRLAGDRFARAMAMKHGMYNLDATRPMSRWKEVLV